MNIVLPGIDYVFELGREGCANIIIENQHLLYEIVLDISFQTEGMDGKAILSDNNKMSSFDKKCELISQFAPFDINRKNLLTKISSVMVKKTAEEKFFMRTSEILADLERYLMEISFDMAGNFEFTKISADSLVKASGLQIENNYDLLGEKLLDYFELVREYDSEKLFVLVNLRSFMSDEETEKFMEDVLRRNMQILMIEAAERKILQFEKRYIVDNDLCVIY